MAPSATQTEQSELPVLDIDSDLFASSPHAAIDAVRLQGRFASSRRGIEVLGHDDVMELLLDSRLQTQDTSVWRQYGAQPRLMRFVEDGLLSAMHGDRHKRIRRVFLAAFRARHIEGQRGLMQDVARGLSASLPATGGDFVELFSSPFPMQVLCRIIGIPVEDIPRFSAAATQLHLLAQTPLEPGFAAIEQALGELYDYCAELVASRRAQPADDAITALIQAQDTEGRITDDELVWNIANLIFAGQDTTRYQLASAVRAVCEQPGLWERLAGDPSLIAGVAEETLRIYPVVNFVVRIPQEDFVYAGVHVRKGRRVILNFQAASRDPERFSSPHSFTPRALTRGAQTFDAPFGLGEHFCLGAALARAEIQEALTVLVAAVTDLDIGVPEMTKPTGMLFGPERLPLTYCMR